MTHGLLSIGAATCPIRPPAATDDGQPDLPSGGHAELPGDRPARLLGV